MTEPTQDEFEISIFVPKGDTPVQVPRDPSVEHHSMRDWVPGLGRVAKVGAEEVQEQWTRTVDTLMKLSSTVAARSKEWSIEEIEVGLTLSAKGELLFIAEAGAEASIKFKLTRKGEPTPEAPALGSRVPSGS
ncbi:Pepco domain-containing protein [Erythrobacter sp. EC-HK427]|uniref:Pepco domain-containing protein n=1 Tax=Erythrobacter sp. EC-HK427 TaxID=2038396 RepID=UPI00125BEF45|nr:hypothetical protein [Erythrobacter sp. EC-HK427]VVT00552.1 conserved hypothetical protein [Erythrobacter sp. EC-HK427]